jgi:hypothetical protein
VYLIVDRHPVHVSEAVALWSEKHQDRIRLIYVPAYSPELNPGEYLNQDVKTNSGDWASYEDGDSRFGCALLEQHLYPGVHSFRLI